MCRFLILSSSEEVLLSEVILRAENSLVQQSFDAHSQQGFGVAWYHPHAPAPALFKSIEPAWSNANLREMCAATRSSCMLAHVRAATPGSIISRENSHPFKFGRLLFCHNGHVERFDGVNGIKRAMRQGLSEEAYDMIQGTTDSETLFALLVSALPDPKRASAFRADELVDALLAMVRTVLRTLAECSVGEGFTTLNCCLSDGETSVVSRFCDKPAVPPPSLYFAFTDARALRAEFTGGNGGGPGDGSDEAPQVEVEVQAGDGEGGGGSCTPRARLHGQLADARGARSFQDVVDSPGGGEAGGGFAFMVASSPLTASARWHAVESGSILVHSRGQVPETVPITAGPAGELEVAAVKAAVKAAAGTQAGVNVNVSAEAFARAAAAAVQPKEALASVSRSPPHACAAGTGAGTGASAQPPPPSAQPPPPLVPAHLPAAHLRRPSAVPSASASDCAGAAGAAGAAQGAAGYPRPAMPANQRAGFGATAALVAHAPAGTAQQAGASEHSAFVTAFRTSDTRKYKHGQEFSSQNKVQSQCKARRAQAHGASNARRAQGGRGAAGVGLLASFVTRVELGGHRDSCTGRRHGARRRMRSRAHPSRHLSPANSPPPRTLHLLTQPPSAPARVCCCGTRHCRRTHATAAGARHGGRTAAAAGWGRGGPRARPAKPGPRAGGQAVLRVPHERRA
jgi:predicted glutamine amidotransferase